MQKRTLFFARIFDMTMHTIISGDTNDHKEIQSTGREKGGEEERRRNRDREAQSDHMIREPKEGCPPPPVTPGGIDSHKFKCQAT